MVKSRFRSRPPQPKKMRRKPAEKPVVFELRGVVRDFLDGYALGPSRKTEASYRLHLGAFEKWMTEQGVRSLLDVTPEILRDWLIHETRHSGLAPNTLVLRQGSVTTFLNWCVDQRYIKFSPMARVKRVKGVEPDRVGFSQEEARRLISTARNAPGWLRERDRAIVLFLLDTGARAAELLSLTPQSFDWPHRQVRLIGKGNRRRSVPLGHAASQAMRDYLRVRPESPYENVFLSARRTVMNYGALSMMLTNLGGYCDPPVENVTAHRFRHTFAAEWYRKHRDIVALQQLLGHSKIETTQRYLRSLGISYALERGYTSPGDWLDE